MVWPLEQMAYRPPPVVWNTVMALAATAVLLYAVWGPN
jgi:hypothetical protein